MCSADTAAKALRRILVTRASKAEDKFAVVVAEFGDGGEPIAEGVFGGAEGSRGASSTSR